MGIQSESKDQLFVILAEMCFSERQTHLSADVVITCAR